MAKNDFKPFATGAGANVMSQADWEALPALLTGFQSGKASSAQMNKIFRQAGFIAAALAQYTANKSGLDVLDDGDVSGFITKMTTAFGKDFQGLDATLTALAGLATGANKLPYFTGADAAAQTDLTSVGRDIIGQSSIANLLTYLGLGAGAPAIGIPFFWPSSAMPNTVMTEWADMVFLRFNGATFSASNYPKLALVFPALTLPEARGEFIRIWDDGRGVDSGRALLSAQSDDFKTHEHKILGTNGSGGNVAFGTISNASPFYTNGVSQPGGSALPAFQNPGGTETRPRNIAFNFLVRAK
ncbi:phage tail protein [Enterobacter asburiae]|uniref:phage tail protein n=1 Tax=Enterobacter asburiae TaxID=61645 RepID=UPI000BA01B1B|nr:phage tail protein [Enterobacter asburiae]MCE1344918.1 phage tail protein [Enterobacter asburiae]OZP65397.1 phage tail protein [Enterobacter asburiae]QBB03635.1 phage tail protein [Enterobacter cloacae]